MTEGEMLDFAGGAVVMAHRLDVTLVDIVGGHGPILEVPHDLARRLGIVHVDQRERQPGHVVLEVSVWSERDLWRILLGGGAVRGRRLQVFGRHDLYRHALLDEREAPGA